jgi:hypothetical protein
MTRHSGSERGAALALVLFALVVIGALVGTVIPLASLEQRAGGNARYAAEAEEAADAGPVAVLAGWGGYRLDTLAVNGTAALGPVLLGGRPDVRWTATVVRLNGQLFLVRSAGIRLDGAGAELARREVAQVLRLEPDTASAGAGITGAIFARKSTPATVSARRNDFSRVPAADRAVRTPRSGTAGTPAAAPTASAGGTVAPLRYRGWARVY